MLDWPRRFAIESGTETIGQASAFVQQFRLIVDEDPPREFRSSTDRAVVGTHESADLVLGDRTVSRFHCEILVREGRVLVRDLGSRNGTLVNGVSVLEAHLTNGAVIGVGRTIMRFEAGSEQVAIPMSRAGSFGRLVGRSAVARSVFALLERAAQTPVNLLIEGETGTGKDAVAESVHQLSDRREGPFVVVDCGSLPRQLLDSELFGHERGAFTGADSKRDGAFVAAHGGTLYLDEVGELPLDLQPKLLRALDRGEVKAVGQDHYQKVDVRVIASTRRSLRVEVNSHRLRPDLYYRLAVVAVSLPPLRDRLEDLPDLVEHFLGELGASKHPSATQLLGPTFLGELASHGWPGNLRELRNYLERCLAFSGQPQPLGEGGEPTVRTYREMKKAWERGYVDQLLARNGDNVSASARQAGLERSAFYRLLWRHGIR